MEEKPQRNKKTSASKVSDNEETGVDGTTKGKPKKKLNKKERKKANRMNR